ncbi:hypothetical protein CRG98_041475 [Punica granatum]|uniref:Uncharacterized protein n=1 Tax=Punica granatum TaxID=22663 RepID=A0A2I0I317_PUNGR|nr:hypothetical protein CRG98_041475 [Punica granatum]
METTRRWRRTRGPPGEENSTRANVEGGRREFGSGLGRDVEKLSGSGSCRSMTQLSNGSFDDDFSRTDAYWLGLRAAPIGHSAPTGGYQPTRTRPVIHRGISHRERAPSPPNLGDPTLDLRKIHPIRLPNFIRVDEAEGRIIRPALALVRGYNSNLMA